MQVVLFAPDDSEPCQKTRAALSALLTSEMFEDFNTLDALMCRLRRPLDPAQIIVLLVPCENYLRQMEENAELFKDVQIVFAAPFMGNGIAERAHRLRPRVVLDLAQAPRHVPAIVENVIRREVKERTRAADARVPDEAGAREEAVMKLRR